MKNKQAFTLIELLVVVLIIGILASIALPQYQKSVEKSKAMQAVTLLKSVYQAAENYYLANGTWPQQFDELSVDIPWTGTVEAFTLFGGQALSNNDWSLQIFNQGSYSGLLVTRLSGKYAGGQFQIWKTHESSLVPTNTLLCGEMTGTNYTIEQEGSFCKKLFQSTQKVAHGSGGRSYTFVQ